MTDFVDLAFIQTEEGYFDFDIKDGDFVTTQGFDSALLMSFFCNKRATASEVGAPQNRRGWWGNEALDFDNYNIGSKMWLLEQSRNNQQTLNDAKTYMEDSLAWMLQDGFLDNTNVTTEYKNIGHEPVMEINVDLIRFQNSVESRGFRIWQNTSKVDVI